MEGAAPDSSTHNVENETKVAPVTPGPGEETASATPGTPVSAGAETPTDPQANDNECPKPPCPERPKPWQTWLLGTYLLLIFILIGYLLLKLWIKRVDGAEIQLFWGWFHRQIQEDNRLLAIVMVAGALGGFFHAAKSFVAFVGNQRIYVTWFWWYLVRPFSGMALATIFYFLIRGGLLTGQVSPDNISIYGIAALASLAGMFEDQAALKLKEFFTNFFKADDQRKDKLDQSNGTTGKPAIKSLSKQEVQSGQDAELTITGTGFVKDSTVNVADKAIETVFVSATELKARLKAADIPSPGTFDLIVVNPPAARSAPVKLKVS